MSDEPDTPFDLGALAPTERPSDPTRTPAAKVELPKRFYTDVATAEGPEGHELRLDGKPVRTPARHLLAVPTPGLSKKPSTLATMPSRNTSSSEHSRGSM